MAYVMGNPRTKKELKGWVEKLLKPRVFQPGPFGPDVKDGLTTLEGPHYPEAHRWYARVEVKDGRVVRVVS